MPNRILKESICTSETIDELSPEAEVFFYRLLVTCDDFGRMDARPAILLGRCFPLKLGSISVNKITGWMAQLEKANLLQVYAVDGKRYLQITTWADHQHRRANHSKYPASVDGIPTSASTCEQMQADASNCEQIHPRNRGIEESRNEESRNEESPQARTPKKSASTDVDGYTPEFESFWNTYPKRIAKPAAYRCWNARLKDGISSASMVSAAGHYAAYCDQQGTETKFIKHAATFLGPDRHFEDFVEGCPVEPVTGGKRNGSTNRGSIGCDTRTYKDWDDFNRQNPGSYGEEQQDVS